MKILYDRCLDFSEDKIDSIQYYADYISKEADLLKYNRGNVLSLRLKGICEDLSNNYEKAIEYYLQSLQAARLIKAPEYELAALSDLAIAYFAIREPEKAKEFYLQCARMTEGDGKIPSLINTYNNLAVIYTQLKQYDSSRILLEKAVQLGRPLERRGLISLSSTYNNLGNLYFKEKMYDAALPYFHQNLVRHSNNNDLSSLWVAKLNLADVFIEKRQFDSATIYAEGAMEIAQRLESKSKEADSYSILAKLAEYSGNYKKAYQYVKDWYSLDTAILHSDTYKTIASLQERFHAKEREAENILLQDKIEKETIRTREVTLVAAALGIIGVLIAIGFILKREAHRRLKATNDLIVQQNARLSELNYEKNSLISIVSHDLNTPFATIQIWGQVLQNDFDRLTEEQQKAMNRILQAGAYGERLIRQILDVERADIGNHKMQLEKFDLRAFSEEMVENFKPMANRKRIVLHTEIGKKLFILSDRYLVSRICENLLSNAIKYTPQGRNVWLQLNEDVDTISLKVRDEGVGIDKEELPYLFSKYSKISSRPTDGEGSNGLGLSIVKRLVEEINGRITCESEVGKGSVFTVVLKK
ncbi:ATP-binding protein [Niastella sp. OAS944]|uniref:tetratricopeptide repeat-containing sensor histidine kinase n=1 Tax=Niastella sp. OAS944 TaxID=2664089 RepID=UPI0035C81BBC|nr:signal transduction histidine kinase/Tfp pilus assembly protein PilF [Chitinophagaceae bacterium OAS944]